MRLSVSNSAFGSDSCSLSGANALTVCVVARRSDVATATVTAIVSTSARFTRKRQSCRVQSCNPAMLQFCNTIVSVAEVFSITLIFPNLDDPDFPRALELARQSAEFHEIGAGSAARYRARFRAADAPRLLDVFNIISRS